MHFVALQHPIVAKAALDIELSANAKAIARCRPRAPVFVSGIARAGTSLFVRTLHATGEFGAPSYRDMPFALMPNLWAKLSGKSRRVEASERGHGDGLTHDLDSPEAIEEIFWRTHCGRSYMRADRLVPHGADDEVIEQYRGYVKSVLVSQRKGRFLSKDNNHILRLPLIVQSFPDAVLIHPFRDPIQQAISLRTQHVQASRLQSEDPFRRRYMDWLGHHEFGLGHRPFCPPGFDPSAYAIDSLDYWLAIWDASYRYLLDSPTGEQHFFDYDELCAHREGVNRLAAVAGVSLPSEGLAWRVTEAKPSPAVDPALMGRAAETHAMMRARAS